MKMRKGQTAMEYLMTYGWAILIIMVVLAVLFYLGVLNPQTVTPNQCTFPPGFTCVTNKLSLNGQLYLVVGQGTGKNIRITGINCTQNTTTEFMTEGQVFWLNETYLVPYQPNITISSGNQMIVADPTSNLGWVNGTICTDANGNPLVDQPVGAVYNGKIYVNYTETDTGVKRIVVGTYTAKFEV